MLTLLISREYEDNITDKLTRSSVFEIRLSNLLARKLKNQNINNVYRFYCKNLPKVTGPYQLPLAVGHRTTAKVDDWKLLYIVLFHGGGRSFKNKIQCTQMYIMYIHSIRLMSILQCKHYINFITQSTLELCLPMNHSSIMYIVQIFMYSYDLEQSMA